MFYEKILTKRDFIINPNIKVKPINSEIICCLTNSPPPAFHYSVKVPKRQVHTQTLSLVKHLSHVINNCTYQVQLIHLSGSMRSIGFSLTKLSWEEEKWAF